MSASLPVIVSSDEEDARIHEHEIALERVKHMKEECQRQQEEEARKAAEAKHVCKEVEAEKAQRDAEVEEAHKVAEVEEEKQQRDTEAEEAQKMAEAEEAQQKAEAVEEAWKDAEKAKKAEASAAWRKQLELLSQRKVAARIAQEEEVQRASEANEGAMLSGIAGYRKGKALEKRVCTSCLKKGVECKWDKGGQGKSKKDMFFLFDFTQKRR